MSSLKTLKFKNSLVKISIIDEPLNNEYKIRYKEYGHVLDYEKILQTKKNFPVTWKNLIRLSSKEADDTQNFSDDVKILPALHTFFLIETIDYMYEKDEDSLDYIELLLKHFFTKTAGDCGSLGFINFLFKFHFFIFTNIFTITTRMKQALFEYEYAMQFDVRYFITYHYLYGAGVSFRLADEIILLSERGRNLATSYSTFTWRECKPLVDRIWMFFDTNKAFLTMFALSPLFRNIPSVLTITTTYDLIFIKSVAARYNKNRNQEEKNLWVFDKNLQHEICNLRYAGLYEGGKDTELLMLGEVHVDENCTVLFDMANAARLVDKYEMVLIENAVDFVFYPEILDDQFRKVVSKSIQIMGTEKFEHEDRVRDARREAGLVSVLYTFRELQKLFSKKIVSIDYRSVFLHHVYTQFKSKHPELAKDFIFPSVENFVPKIGFNTLKALFYFVKFLYDNYIELLNESVYKKYPDAFKFMPHHQILANYLLARRTQHNLQQLFPLDVDYDMCLVNYITGAVHSLNRLDKDNNYFVTYGLLHSMSFLHALAPLIEIFLMNCLETDFFRGKKTLIVAGNAHIEMFKYLLDRRADYKVKKETDLNKPIVAIEFIRQMEQVTGIELRNPYFTTSRTNSAPPPRTMGWKPVRVRGKEA